VLSLNILSNRGRTIRPKTLNQKRYVDAIDKHTIVFGIGPAGTGKTYLAMAKAVQALQAKQVNRIILTRPAVEAGERLGFLPGTLYEKIDPYLRPLYDALHDMLDPESIPRLMAAGTIEVAPLAYMRGRTLNDAFIILDEAQNTSPEQMKMFLTRLGFGSKIVVTGDVTQVDLPGGTSGLRVVRDILEGVEDVHFSELTSTTWSGTSWSAEIVDAYERYDAATGGRGRTAHGPGGRRGRRGEVGAPMSDRGQQRVRVGDRRVARSSGSSPGSRWTGCGSPARRAVDPARRRGRHGRAARSLDGPAGPDRRAGLPDGRAASPPGPGRRRAPAAGAARRHRALPEVAAKQAARPGHSMDDELHLLTVHGVLHLLGYDHAEPEEEREMFGLQAALLRAGAPEDGCRAAGLPGRPPAMNLPGSWSSPRGRCWWCWPAVRLRRRGAGACPGPAPRSWCGGAAGRAPSCRGGRRRPRAPQPAAAAAAALRAGRDRAGHRRLRGQWGRPGGLALAVAARDDVVSYVAVGVAPRTLGRQHAYRSALVAAGPLMRWPGCSARCRAADPDRQRAHPRQGLPRGPVRDRGRAARAGRPGRAARRDRGRASAR
jgi:hypothetical protein